MFNIYVIISICYLRGLKDSLTARLSCWTIVAYPYRNADGKLLLCDLEAYRQASGML